jgi:hypothetical protein
VIGGKPAEIPVLPTRTGGVFDWKKRQRKRSAVFKWTGKASVLQVKDPVEDVNPGGRVAWPQ